MKSVIIAHPQLVREVFDDESEPKFEKEEENDATNLGIISLALLGRTISPALTIGRAAVSQTSGRGSTGRTT